MNDQKWSIHQRFDDEDDEFDIQIGRGMMFKNSFSSMNTSSQISSSGYQFKGVSKQFKYNQAFIKITGHKTSAAQLKAHIDYITREGNIQMEDERGEIFSGADRDKMATEWVYDFERRKKDVTLYSINKSGSSKSRRNRVAAAFVFSSPEGTNTDALLDSVREFAKKNFSGHRYAFVAHTPETEVVAKKVTPNPHVHLVIENISPGVEKALETNPEILRNWRRDYADISIQHGIKTVEMDLSRKPAPHEKNPNIYRMLKSGKIPDRYKDYYQAAKDRVKRGDIQMTPKEKELVENAKNQYSNRARQIDDLNTLIDSTTNGADKFQYAKEVAYLKEINNSMRMPANNSQMFLKHAMEQEDRQKGKGSKQFNAVPTVKHYLYAEKLAKAHGVKLPAGANVSVNRLNEFVNEYGNKATPKFISLMKTVAKDRGIKLHQKDIASHKAAVAWMSENKDHPTVKQLAQANKLSKQFGIILPDELNSKSLKEFISSLINRPSEQMMDFANSIEQRTGIELSDSMRSDKRQLAKYITENKSLGPELSSFTKELESLVKKPLVEKEHEIIPNPLNEAIKRELLQLRNHGYYQSAEDIDSVASAQMYISAIKPSEESARWLTPLGAIEGPNKVKDRSKGFDGPGD
jgi:hypothetical protein